MTAPFDRALLASIEQAALAAWNEEKQQAFHYRFSSAGGPCIRALAFEARGAKNEMHDIRHVMNAACGNAIGELIESGARKLGWSTQEYVELPDSSVLVAGNLDFANPEIVVDGKVVNDKQWKRLDRGPRFKDHFQVNGYAVSSQRPFWALGYLRGSSIYDSSPKPDWRIFTGKADPALALAMAKIWETVDAHTKAGTLPPIPPGFAPDRFPCGWKTGGCAHRKECYPNG